MSVQSGGIVPGINLSPSTDSTTEGSPEELPVHDVVIVGSGPAGWTAALYTARANLKPLIFAGELDAGGALMTTTEVENFPGFPEGVMGPELMGKMQEQAERFGTEVEYEDVTSVDFSGPLKRVSTEDQTVLARTVILANGSAYRKLGLPEEHTLNGKGISWCATCDGFFFREQHVLVIGGGDSAMEEALFLTRFADRVTVVHRREELRASKIMAERALNHEKISFEWNSEVASINGTEKVTGATLRDTITGEEREIEATGVFVAIGHDPRTDILRGHVELDDEGYVVVKHPTTETNVPGVFAAGDVVDHIYRQAITAAGTGCSAALDAERYLADLDEAGVPGTEAAQTAEADVEQAAASVTTV